MERLIGNSSIGEKAVYEIKNRKKDNCRCSNNTEWFMEVHPGEDPCSDLQNYFYIFYFLFVQTAPSYEIKSNIIFTLKFILPLISWGFGGVFKRSSYFDNKLYFWH